MSSLSIVFMIVSGILVIGMPIVFLIYFFRKYRMSWKPVLIGLLIFIVFSQVLEQLLHQYVFKINPATREWMANPYLYALYGGFAAGVFEEVGRFLGFRYLLQKYRGWRDGIAYGIGHGGIEALYIGGLAIISLIINAFMINSGAMDSLIHSNSGEISVSLQAAKDQLVNAPSYNFLMTGLERIFAFVLQLAFSLLVLYGVLNRKKIFLLYAILIHAGVDFVAALFQKLHFNMLVIEGFVCAVAILAAIFIVRSKAMFAKEQL